MGVSKQATSRERVKGIERGGKGRRCNLVYSRERQGEKIVRDNGVNPNPYFFERVFLSFDGALRCLGQFGNVCCGGVGRSLTN